MKYSLTLAALAATSSAIVIPRADSAKVLVGALSKIQIFDYNGKEFTQVMDEKVEGDPSWLAYSEPDTIYAVDEWSSALRQFKLGDNKLEKKDEKEGSSGVVHLEFNTERTRMVGSSYGWGTVDIWNIENGLELMKTINATGQPGPDETQTQPRVHQANLDPSGRFFAANDLGTDTIMVLDGKDDAWTFENYDVPAGCGPRHGAFYPRGAEKATHYMVSCELSNEIIVFTATYEGEKLVLKETQRETTLPADATKEVKEAAAAGELIISEDNKNVYVSNRVTGLDTDNIAIFNPTVSKCGSLKLKAVGFPSSQSVNPRMISLSTSGQTLFAAHVVGEYGLVALSRKEDGTLGDKAAGTIKADKYGKADEFAGPRYVQQIA